MTQEVRKDLSVMAAMAAVICGIVLLISANAAAEHVQQQAPAPAKLPEMHALPR